MSPSTEPSLTEVTFEELERVDQYEATFTGALDGEELTLTYTLESAIGSDEQTIYTPGGAELDAVVVQPDTYEFETDGRRSDSPRPTTTARTSSWSTRSRTPRTPTRTRSA